jgi:hypothetical protein
VSVNFRDVKAQRTSLVISRIKPLRFLGVVLELIGLAIIYNCKLPIEPDQLEAWKDTPLIMAGWTIACLCFFLMIGRAPEGISKKLIEASCEFIFAIGFVFSLSVAISTPHAHFMAHVSGFQDANYRRAVYDLDHAYMDLCISYKSAQCQAIDDLGRAISSWDGAPLNKFVDQTCPPHFDPWRAPAGMNYHLRDACNFVTNLERRPQSSQASEEFKLDEQQIIVMMIVAMFTGLRFALMLNELIVKFRPVARTGTAHSASKQTRTWHQ